MKLLAPTTCLILLHATIGLAADGDQKSALIRDGALQTIKEPTAKILQFKIRDGKLQLDRDAWEPAAREIEKEAAAGPKLPPGIAPNTPEAFRIQARQLEERARQLEMNSRMGPTAPIHILFRNLQETAKRGSHGMNISSGNNGSTFRSDTLAGRLSTNNDLEELSLEETESPYRKIEFVSDADHGFRIELTNTDGDAMVLRQLGDGRFFVISIQHDSVFDGPGRDVCRAIQERSFAHGDRRFLPALAQLGISLMLAPVLPPCETPF